MPEDKAVRKSEEAIAHIQVGNGSIVDVGIGIVIRTVPPTSRTSSQGAGVAYDILITRRHAHTVYGGYWEFPGGKLELGEGVDDCVRRELQEEVGVQVEVIDTLPAVVHTYPHATVRLHPRVCRLAPGSPDPRDLHVVEHRWAPLDEMRRLQFPEANAAVLESLEQALRRW